MHCHAMEEKETLEAKSVGGHSASEERDQRDMTSDVTMGDGDQHTVSSSSGKSERTSEYCREATGKKTNNALPRQDEEDGWPLQRLHLKLKGCSCFCSQISLH